MDGSEIRFQVNQINKQLANEIGQFILTDKIKKLVADKEELQHLCRHNFHKGVCIYCDLKEEDL